MAALCNSPGRHGIDDASDAAKDVGLRGSGTVHGVEVKRLAPTAIGSGVVALVAAAVPTATDAAEAAIVDGDGGAAGGATPLPKVHGSGGCASTAEVEDGRSISVSAAAGLLGVRQGTDADQDADVGRSDVGVSIRVRHGCWRCLCTLSESIAALAERMNRMSYCTIGVGCTSMWKSQRFWRVCSIFDR